MSLLIFTPGAKKDALEVGVFTGYSSLTVALAILPEALCVACDVATSGHSLPNGGRRPASREIDLRDRRLKPCRL